MSRRWWTLLVIAFTMIACRNDPTATVAPPTCAPKAAPVCTLNDGGTSAAFVPCVQDDCSLATLEAVIAIEIQASTSGTTEAASAGVRAVAAQILADFQMQEANLEALEVQLAVKPNACDESRNVAADLRADLAPLNGLGGTRFDDAFLASQKAALTTIKQVINLDLIGCAGNGNLKTTLRFDRLRSPDGGTTATVFDGGNELGVVPDLAAVVALLEANGGSQTVDAGISDAGSEN